MLFRSQAERDIWATAIKLGAQAATAEELRTVLALGQRAKPKGLDTTSVDMALRYSGNQALLIQGKLGSRFPDSAKYMPVTPVNWLAHFARADAGVYIVDAARRLVQTAGVGESGPVGSAVLSSHAMEGFARALEDMRLAQVMPELERRVLTGIKSMAVEVAWRKIAGRGRPAAFLYWPHDVIVITHASAPSDEDAIVICALRQTPQSAMHVVDRDGKHIETWRVWSRDYQEDDEGNVIEWGAWGHTRISSDGSHPAIRQEYQGRRLPVAFVRLEQPDGGFWPLPEGDVIAQVDELNCGRSNEQYVVDLQGHDNVAVTGATDVVEQSCAPDRWVNLGPGVTANVLSYNPKLEAIRESRSGMLREIAVSRANNHEAYSATKSTSVSGVSRAIANIPHDRRIRELRPLFRQFEEQALLPTLIEVLNLFSPASYCPTIPDDVKPTVVFGTPPDYEELDSKQRRLELDLKLRIISPAKYAVLMGHYDNEKAAAADGLSTALGAAPTPTPTPEDPPPKNPGAA